MEDLHIGVFVMLSFLAALRCDVQRNKTSAVCSIRKLQTGEQNTSKQ